jgi:hypothetical protein
MAVMTVEPITPPSDTQIAELTAALDHHYNHLVEEGMDPAAARDLIEAMLATEGNGLTKEQADGILVDLFSS